MPAARSRRFLALGGALTIGAALVAAACGIDVLGSAPLPPGPDGSLDGHFEASVPPSCGTLDASCLGALPAMWQPIALGAPGCGAAFTTTKLLTNPQAVGGACACGECRPVHPFDCTGNSDISGGDTCNDAPIARAAPGACTKANAQHLKATPPQATGTAACAAPNDAGTGVTSDTLTICVPGCGADFCGSAARCVIAEGEQACPSGLQLHAHVGTAADPGCPACVCHAGTPSNCLGTVTAYDNDTCADGGTVTTYSLASCNTFPNGNYGSVRVKLAPPDAGCAPVPSPAPLVGDASLAGVKTICCK